MSNVYNLLSLDICVPCAAITTIKLIDIPIMPSGGEYIMFKKKWENLKER